MSEFKYNKKGELEVYRDGVKIGEVVTMGDLVNAKNEREGQMGEDDAGIKDERKREV